MASHPPSDAPAPPAALYADDEDSNTAALLAPTDRHAAINDDAKTNTAPFRSGDGLPKESSDANDEDADGSPKPSDGPRTLSDDDVRDRRRRLALQLFVVGVPAVFAAFAIGDDRARCTNYTVEAASCDVAGVLIAQAVVTVALAFWCIARGRRGFFGNRIPVTDVIHHVAFAAFICGLAKLWVFRWGKQHPEDSVADAAMAGVLVALGVIATAANLFLNHRVHRVDIPSKVNLKLSSVAFILKPYFWPKGFQNRCLIVSTWLLMGGGKACGVIAPLYLAKAVNKMTGDPPVTPYGDIAIFATLSLAPRVLEEVQDMLVVNIWRVAYVEVADATFRHVHKLSLEWHVQKRMGHVIRFMDRGMNAAQQLVAYVAMYMGPAVAVAISAFIVFATEFNQPKVAAITFLFMALYGWVTVVVTIWRKVFFTEANEHDNDMHDKATDSLVNFETVKYFTNEDLEADNYRESVEQYQRNEQQSRLSVAVLNMGQATIMEYCRMCALMVAANAVVNHEGGFDVGKFMALQAYLVMMFTPFQFLGSIYEMTVESVIDMENLSDLLAEEPDLTDRPDAAPLAPIASSTGPIAPPRSLEVAFDGVTFHYPTQSATEGLKDLSFTVPAGTTTALVGSTGSGKTTITRLLFRFYDVLGGAVRVDGRDVRSVTQRSLRQHIGIVPQDTVLFNDTLRHNVGYGKPGASQEELEEAARKAQLLPLIARLENGWDTVVGERGLKLSGGEKQRVAIARCLLKNPPIVVLDEATSALDNKTEKEVQQALASLAGRTTIIVAHRLSTVQHADQILVMSRGRVVERGGFDELMAKGPEGEFYSMWHAQLKAAQGAGAGDPTTEDPKAAAEQQGPRDE
eukprot:CAMPEP_0174848910 /NCGR_PEP_ID=MMETSP1114-20130205/13798_1 /TAXON_ID=312471 /ORGANISM="Neobodo designis, Strain CCAP 1951/1" /LENGTH=855 /DNA_ID=CAMNT_0016083215 /DNA_START=68 /DNA_END=2635 /DNA_ORIENTATION=+